MSKTETETKTKKITVGNLIERLMEYPLDSEFQIYFRAKNGWAMTGWNGILGGLIDDKGNHVEDFAIMSVDVPESLRPWEDGLRDSAAPWASPEIGKRAMQEQAIQELGHHIEKFFLNTVGLLPERELVLMAAKDYTNKYCVAGSDYRKTFDNEILLAVASQYVLPHDPSPQKSRAAVVTLRHGCPERLYATGTTYSIKEDGEFWRTPGGKRRAWSTHLTAEKVLKSESTKYNGAAH
jgi:hypothetical protein